MPEGDTIYRTAVSLRRALVGREVTGGPERLRGKTVSDIESRGKHLLVWLSPGDVALHTHLGMSGSWHLYRPGERWRRPRGTARAVIETTDWVAVCFGAPVCELLTGSEVARHPQLSSLGPDAMADDPDLGEARRRLDERAGQAVGEALADQRVLAGVGNVYRCEVLFRCAVNPWATVADLRPETRDLLLRESARLLRRNAGTPRRRTTDGPGPDLAVYGKAGRACPRCGQRISADRQGPHARITFWCPGCQTGGVAPPGADAPARSEGAGRTPAS